MTQEDIICMAREAGAYEAPLYPHIDLLLDECDFKRFAALVAAAEREACAQVAESTVCDTHLPTGVQIYGGRVAKAIRARSNT